MKQEIKLFIGGTEIEFAQPPAILFTYTENDITNPTVIKNHYTKTVTVEGTPKNNDTFGHIWNLSRLTNYQNEVRIQTGFNASKKTDFQLFVNGELYESGYVRLNKVKRTADHNTFEITLYGGIGDFFSQLNWTPDGEKLKLSDLTYLPRTETWEGRTFTYPESDDSEFDMEVTKENLARAWNCIEWTPEFDIGESDDSGRKFKYINFAPCYNGMPDFSTDKVLVNFNNSALIPTMTSGDTEYTSLRGYALGKLPEKMDEWAVRDLRSYLQRPVLRMKGFIDACKEYVAKRGYDLVLSPEFFKESNPYYNDTWLTLPMLTEYKMTGTDVTPDSSSTMEHTWRTYMEVWFNGSISNQTFFIEFTPDFPLRAGHIDIDAEFVVSAATYLNRTLYSSAYVGGERNFSAYGVQLLAYAGEDWNSDVVAASPTAWLTSLVGSDYLKPSESGIEVSAFDPTFFNVFGTMEPIGNNSYKWSTPFTLSMDLPLNARSYAIRVQAVANLTKWEKWKRNFWGKKKLKASGVTYDDRQRRYYTSTSLSSTGSTNSVKVNHHINSLTGRAVSQLMSETAGYTGAHLTKRLLLDTKYSPAEYLISFAKLFHLHFYKTPYDNRVYLMTQKEFYEGNEVIDIDDKVDRGSIMEINPEAFESKYYDFSLESTGGEFAEKYERTYSRVYGSQRVDTGFEFETEPKKIFSGNTYNTCVCGVQKSKYYVGPLKFAPSLEMPAYVLQGFTHQLYAWEPGNSDYTTIDVDFNNRTDNLPPLKDEKFYDAFPKPQFRDEDGKAVGGENVLLFFNGRKEMINKDGTVIPYWLTDDMREMAILNDGDATWLYTESQFDEDGQMIAIRCTILPQFSRYVTTDAGTIKYSLDFGEPRQLYTQDMTTNPASTIYSQFWQGFIEDMYNVDTRVVTVNTLLETRPNTDMLRKFYWFDNNTWRLNKITDYSVTSFETTKCEFVRVHDIDAYSDSALAGDKIKMTVTPKSLSAEGGRVVISITSTTDWYFGGDTYLFESDVYSGTGNMSFAVTVYGNSSRQPLDVRFRATSKTDESVFAEETVTLAYSNISLNRVRGSSTIPPEGETSIYVVNSTLPWAFSGGTSALFTAVPSSGVITPDTGTTVHITFPPNEDSSRKYMQLQVVNTAGSFSRVYIEQDAAGSPDATLTPSALTVPIGGGTYVITANTNFNEWETYSYGTYVPEISPTSGDSGITYITFTFPENTGTTDASGSTLLSYGGSQYGYFHWKQEGPFFIKYKSGRGEIGWDIYNINISTIEPNSFFDADGNVVTPVDTTLGPAAQYRCLWMDGVPALITNSAFTHVCQQADTGASLGWMEIPSSVTTVENYAFAGLSGMTAVTCSAVTYFGTGAFKDCSGFETVDLTGAAYLGPMCFKGCRGLEMITYGHTVAQWNAIRKAADWIDREVPVQCTDGLTTT